MKSIFGYIIAGVGLIVLGLNSTAGRKLLPFLEKVDSIQVIIFALSLIILGILIASFFGKSSSKIRHITKEVPIYQGEGKKRRIVGYKAE